MSDFPFSPVDSAGLRRNDPLLPSSPLHHNYPLESDGNPLLRSIIPMTVSQFSQPIPFSDTANASMKAAPSSSGSLSSSFPEAFPMSVEQGPQSSSCFPAIPMSGQGAFDSSFPSSLQPFIPMSHPSIEPLSLQVPSVEDPVSLKQSNQLETPMRVPSFSHAGSSSTGIPDTKSEPNMFDQGETKMENEVAGSTKELEAPSQKRKEVSKSERAPVRANQTRPRGRRSSPNSTLVCPECNQFYSRPDNLRAHIRGIHHGDKPYQCSHCGEHFRWASTLRSHESTNRCRRDGLGSRRRSRGQASSSTVPSPQSTGRLAPVSNHATTVASPSQQLSVPMNIATDINNQPDLPRDEPNPSEILHPQDPHVAQQRQAVLAEITVNNERRVPMQNDGEDGSLLLPTFWRELVQAFDDSQDINMIPEDQ